MKSTSMKMTQTKLHAGTFSTWLRNIRQALSEKKGMNVPCGECSACCRSSLFIYIKSDETQTLNRIPSKLLFPAPFHPQGYKVLGFDNQGRCPMLVKNTCSIYRNRPATCRYFDCRILAASGIETESNTNIPIFQHGRRWEFNYPHAQDCVRHLAVQDAAKYLIKHPKCIKENFISGDAIQLSVLAIKVYDVFLKSPGQSNNGKRDRHVKDMAKKVLKSYERFEKHKGIA